MKKQFILHEDGCHGWLEVSYKDITDLNIQNEISDWSYINRTTEKIYSKLYDSAGYLMTNHSDLPKTIGKIKLRLNKKEIAKLSNILWYIAHSELWKDNNG